MAAESLEMAEVIPKARALRVKVPENGVEFPATSLIEPLIEWSPIAPTETGQLTEVSDTVQPDSAMPSTVTLKASGSMPLDGAGSL
jgi:hypothetical protein